MDQSNCPLLSNQDGQTAIPSTAVGFILLNNGSLFSFGLLPPSVEARAAPGPVEWNEIKICPPLHVLSLPATKLPICCADYCNDKIKSHEAHAKKHLNQILEEQCKMSRLNCDFPSSLQIKYYCNQTSCYSGLQMLDQSRGFSRMKYLRQHYLKVHAPKTFACSTCSKSFATLGLLGGHIKSCGNSFECSTCQKQYNTLEALQTHCRRNEHSTDYSQYKNLIENAKNEISALRKAEKDLKQKGLKQPQPLPVQVIIPRPKTITCGLGGTPSHVIWTYDCGFDTPKVKAETYTQTETEITTPEACSSKSNNNNANANNSTSGIERRKRSAETQTGKMKYKVSTEAQTLNVTKRRRTSKKQIAEAETQCSVPNKNPTNSRSDSDEISTPEHKSTDSSTTTFLPVVTCDSSTQGGGNCSTPAISLQSLMSMVGIIGDSNEELQVIPITSSNNENDPLLPPLTPNVVNVLDQQFEIGINGYTTSPGVSTSEVCVGFDEPFDLEDFLQFELTRETQTDASLIHPNFLDISEPEVNDDDFNNLVTTETQTYFVISDSSEQMLNPMDNNTSWTLNFLTPASSSSEWNRLPINNSYYNSLQHEEYPTMISSQDRNSPSYLETIDGETQTTFTDNIHDDQYLDTLLTSVFDSPTRITDQDNMEF